VTLPPLQRSSRALLLALSVLLSACGASEPPSNLLFISLDTTRQDRLSLYGYERPTTPRLDALAETSAVFENAFAQSTITTPTHTAMFTGLYPATRSLTAGKEGHGHPTLASVLAESGYRTGAFTSGFPMRMKNHGLRQGFEVWDANFTGPRRKGASTVALALDWLQTLEPDERFMLFVHLYDAHGPYEPDESYRVQFVSAEPGDELDYLPRYQRTAGPDGEIVSRANEILDRYDASVRYQDDLADRLLDAVDLDRTIVVVVADHGETFYERGPLRNLSHGDALFDEQLRIPFMIHAPGVAAGRFHEPVEQIDLMPTLLDLLEMNPEGEIAFQGGSLAPLLRGERGERRDGLTFASVPYDPKKYRHLRRHNLVKGRMATARSKSWKLVSYAGAEDNYYELFYLEDDPEERQNVAAEQPEMLARMRLALETWSDELGGPSPDVELSADDLQQLRSLGYVD
jgi:arylsulfatase